MENGTNNMKSTEKQDFTKEYQKIIDFSETTVVVESEWSKDGDYFQKLSMYDNNYTSIPTLGGTTLIR